MQYAAAFNKLPRRPKQIIESAKIFSSMDSTATPAIVSKQPGPSEQSQPFKPSPPQPSPHQPQVALIASIMVPEQLLTVSQDRNIATAAKPEQTDQSPKKEEESDYWEGSVVCPPNKVVCPPNNQAQKEQQEPTQPPVKNTLKNQLSTNQLCLNVFQKGDSTDHTAKEETIELPSLKVATNIKKEEQISINRIDAVRCLRAIRKKIPSVNRLRSIFEYMDRQLRKGIERSQIMRQSNESEEEVIGRSFLDNGYGMAVIRLYDSSISPNRYNLIISMLMRNAVRKLQEKLLLQGLEIGKFKSKQEYLLRAPLIDYKGWMKPNEANTFRKLLGLSLKNAQASFASKELPQLYTAICDKLEERLLSKGRGLLPL